jgi:YVTN family beta-propeller protein
MRNFLRQTWLAVFLLPLLLKPVVAGDFVNFEVPTVHPLDLSPDGRMLAVCHTADNRVLLYSMTSGTPVASAALSVGLDPVSVRWRTATELWVANHTSDSISVVDATHCTVTQTLQTKDEPVDVVFAGVPQRAWVACSQVNTLQLFDPANLAAGVTNEVVLEGEDPRSLAVSPDGSKVYVAIFESGNGSTSLAGGGNGTTISFPPNVVSNVAGPYGGVNPPPNSGANFVPARNVAAGAAPAVGLIVKKNAAGAWMDDNNRNWTSMVSGPNAALSGRVVGWDVVDNDVAVIDTANLSVTYATRLMNLCMALGVNPATGKVTLVGTEATNEVRFEPNVKGKFVRVRLGSFLPSTPATKSIVDLNPHLTYATHNVSQVLRDNSVGDPRAIVWKADGTRGYVAGMGSNNIAVIDANGARLGAAPINVGQGPVGLALDEARGQLYALNRFDGSLSIVSLTTETELARQPFFDPTPPAIKSGRPFLYDTRRTSGLGQASCASCHADARMDRLAWDLGDPSGTVKNVTATLHNLGASIPGLNTGFTNFHPMKGPMTTQTLQDIIGKEPHHWRGDRNGLEEFNAAFVGLLGDDVELTAAEMQQFEDFLATIAIPPNPFRNLDNTLPTNLPLTGHVTSARFGAAGLPMLAGNPLRGLNTLYRPLSRGIDAGTFACVTCHTVPTGMGADAKLSGASFVPIPAGPNAERHHALVSSDGSSQRAIKVPQLRNLYDKVGCELSQTRSLSGFGFLHDGTASSLTEFLSELAFTPNNNQEVADLVALMLCFSGSGFGAGPDALEPPGTPSQDAHAAVGKQALLTSASLPAADLTRLNTFITLANASVIDLFAKANVNGAPRGWHYQSANNFRSDQAGITETLSALLARASVAEPILFTVTPRDTGRRLGIDRDRDNLLDYDEVRDLVSSVPGVQNPFRADGIDNTGNNGSMIPDGLPDGQNDFDNDGQTNAAEFLANTNPVTNWTALAPPLGLTMATNHPFTSVTLTWNSVPHGEYEISYSHDLMLWTPLASGKRSADAIGGLMTWTDDGPPDTAQAPTDTQKRFYRIERTK